MSSFKASFRHKATGEVHEVWCMDDYFGRHEYGYIPSVPDAVALTESEFKAEYERVKDVSDDKTVV